jgi:hypothetical protein
VAQAQEVAGRHDAAVEELLTGGNTHGGVVKVGHTVRRPTGPWTPAVHALLGHLEAVGFEAAPRALGIDERGREILMFAAGRVVWPDHADLVSTDVALAEVAGLVRRFHDAVAGFPLGGEHTWSDRGSDPSGPHELLCHNDLAPWNLVHGGEGSWTFIDWDLAAPGRRAWDLAWALLGFVPLMHFSTLTEDETRHRIGVFREAYGPALFPADVLAVAAERCGHEARRIYELGARGEEPYATLLAEGHYETWAEAERHVERHMRRWSRALP